MAPTRGGLLSLLGSIVLDVPEGQEGIAGLWKSPRSRRTGRRKSPTCHTRHGGGTWGHASGAAQAGSRGPSAPAFVLSACTLPEVNHAFFTFAEGDRFALSSSLSGWGRGAKPRGRDGGQGVEEHGIRVVLRGVLDPPAEVVERRAWAFGNSPQASRIAKWTACGQAVNSAAELSTVGREAAQDAG